MIDAIMISLILEGVGLSIHAAKEAEAFARKVRKKATEKIVAKWRSGQRSLGESRLDVARFLHRYYSPGESTAETYRGVCYRFPEHLRILPLITKSRYLLKENSAFCVKGESKGVKAPRVHLTKDSQRSSLIEPVALWSALNLRVFDAPLYSLQEVSSEGSVSFGLARFLDYRSTFGALPDELALASADHSIEQISKASYAHLPLRTEILSTYDQLTNFSGRAVAGGIAVLFAIRFSDDDVGILLQRRSSRVSDEYGVLSVVPKAFHQPTVDAEFEVDPVKTIRRECYEELFGGEEAPMHVDPEYYLQKCEAIRELTEQEVATIQPTGLIWDLSRGNYHLLYCCFVQSARWWERYKSDIRLNWEVDPEVRPLVRLRDTKMLSHALLLEGWAPESYVAFVEGLRWLCAGAQLSDEVSSPVGKLLPDLMLRHMEDLGTSQEEHEGFE